MITGWQKWQKNGKPNTWAAFKTLARKLDINVAGQARWIKYKSYKMMKKKISTYIHIKS
jgi:hypothetical protein